MVKNQQRQTGSAIRRGMILSLTVILVLLFSGQVLAAGNLVDDLADLFTDAEEAELAATAASLGSQYQMDIVLVTTNDTGGLSARDYADDYFDYNGYGMGGERNGILFLMDFDNREIYISTSGSSIRYLTDQRISGILDDVYEGGMGSGDYIGAARVFLAETSGYLASGIPTDQYNEAETEPNKLTAVEGAVGAAASGLSGLGFFSGIKKKYRGKNTKGVFEFRQNSLMSLGIIQDNLINTRMTSRHIPVQNVSSGGRSSSGRSSTHTSSSGRSHGGGGRKF